MAIDIKFNLEARSKILSGARSLAKAVGVTLGPRGRNVIIQKSYGAPLITKDGVSVAKEIELEDNHENMAAQIMKQIAQKTADHSGDGTTTSTILGYEILKRGNRYLLSGANSIEISRGIHAACHYVCEDIKQAASKIKTQEQIEQVAMTSGNSDKEIGDMIAKAVQEVGHDGVITVEEGKGSETSVVVTHGMEIDRGYLSPYFINKGEKMIVEYEKPFILVCEQKITRVQDILPILEKVVQTGRGLLIIAEDIEGEALATLVLNRMRGGLKVVAIKAPGFGDRRKAMLEDIAVLTGATVITSDLGLKIENTDLEHLGTIERLEVHKDKTLLVGASHAEKNHEGEQYQKIMQRCNMIRKEINETTSDYDKEKLQERLARLSSGVAVIKVGGATEVEMKERKDRVDDAVSATKAAIELGVVAGGGVSLLRRKKKLQQYIASLKNVSHDQMVGMQIVAESLSAPLELIMRNAGLNPSEIEFEILKSDNHNYGYDVINQKYCDLMQAGVIDPVKVVIDSIQNAGSAAGTLLTVECAIIQKPSKESKSAGMPDMGGMGGMGGMY